MKIEELITVMANSQRAIMLCSLYDRQTIHSINSQIRCGTHMTEKQSVLALRILKKHRLLLNSVLNTDITPYLDNPTYQYPFRILNSVKRITVVEHDHNLKVIRVVLPYNDVFVKLIKEDKAVQDRARWDGTNKWWNFQLTDINILFLKDVAEGIYFETDEEFRLLAAQVNGVVKNIDTIIPILAISEGKPILKNAVKYMPVIQSDNLLDALFEARRIGVLTWDDKIEEFINSNEINSYTKDFLTKDPMVRLQINCNTNSMDVLKDIVTRMMPCLFVVPGGSELAKTKIAYDFLKRLNLKDEEISIFFRCPSDTGAEFNEFVKTNKLNSPITDATKVVFVSGKLPKPIIKSNIKFNSIINMGFTAVHYSLMGFFDSHPNLIFFTELKDIRSSYHGNL